MSVKVVARLRPLLKTEAERETIVTAHRQPQDGDDAAAASSSSLPSTLIRIPNPRNEGENFTFQFNRVFEAHTTQKELFDAEIKPTIKHLFSGYDVTLFAYGVTGTGKTHTMRGGKSLEDRGIIPRLLSSIYRKSRTMSTLAKGPVTEVSISMSYYEIYNDKVYDLFEPPEKRTPAGLPLRDNGSRTVVVGLTERSCEDLKTFEKLYDQANVNRSTSATKLNAHSSRSHAILRVKLTITTGEKTVVSTASCIDLAGSEDNRRTDNNRERLVESSAINKSLFTLSQCVEAISKGQQRIPYRESKMTRILSLGQNNGLCICLLNLAPVRSYHLDTLSSLNFANRTKKIEIREAENDPIFAGAGKMVPGGGVALPRAPLGLRQPLKALSTTTHNTHVKRSAPDADTNAETKTASSKPAKAFTVFSDKPRQERKRRSSGAPKRQGNNSPNKRNSSTFISGLPKSTLAAKSPKKRTAAALSTKRTSAINATAAATAADTANLSQAAIEQLVERKVSEMLASRALESTAAPQRDVSDEVKRRLEMLERKVEEAATAASDDDAERVEGLSFLLMAKQHLARGEEVSALKMYQLAKKHFPENAKLDAKMARLRERIEGKRQSVLTMKGKDAAYVGKENIPPEFGYRDDEQDGFWQADDRAPQLRDVDYTADLDTGYVNVEAGTEKHESQHEADPDFDPSAYSPSRPAPKKRKRNKVLLPKLPPPPQLQPLSTAPLSIDHVAPLQIQKKKPPRPLSAPLTALPSATGSSITYSPTTDTTSALTPRAQRLLDIINSRDALRIRELRGVGAKRAEGIIEALRVRGGGLVGVNGDASLGLGGSGDILDLEALAELKGVGVKTVERMREGLAA